MHMAFVPNSEVDYPKAFHFEFADVEYGLILNVFLTSARNLDMRTSSI